MREPLTEQIEALINPPIDELSAELIELDIKHHGNTVVIDIVVDKLGGITIKECVFINKKVDHALERKQWFGEDYVVKVSSPGLDRALKTSKDFTRAKGRAVRFHLSEPVEGKIEHLGEVFEVEGDKIAIKKKDQAITIPLKHILKAVQVIN